MYSKKAKHTFGGDKTNENGDYLISQSQHFTANNEFYYATEIIGNRVVKLQYETGNHVSSIGEVGFMAGEFDVPSGVAICCDSLIVCDLNNGRIQSFKLNGDFIAEHGSKGSGPGQFDKPTSLAVDDAKNIYVTDMANSRIQVLDCQFKHKQDIKCGLDGMTYISYDQHHKRLVVSDSDANTVKFISLDGKEIGSISDAGSEPGQIMYPCGTAIDNSGNIILCDYVNNRVQVFNSDGKFLSSFGADGEKFEWPVDVCIVDDEISILDGVSFAGWNRIQVY